MVPSKGSVKQQPPCIHARHGEVPKPSGGASRRYARQVMRRATLKSIRQCVAKQVQMQPRRRVVQVGCRFSVCVAARGEGA